MIRNIIGSIIMFFFGWIIIYGLYEAVFGAENRAGAIGAVIITLPFFMAGYKLRKSGTDKKKIKEYALKKQSECGFVNASDVAENTKTNALKFATLLSRRPQIKSLIKMQLIFIQKMRTPLLLTGK